MSAPRFARNWKTHLEWEEIDTQVFAATDVRVESSSAHFGNITWDLRVVTLDAERKRLPLSDAHLRLLASRHHSSEMLKHAVQESRATLRYRRLPRLPIERVRCWDSLALASILATCSSGKPAIALVQSGPVLVADGASAHSLEALLFHLVFGVGKDDFTILRPYEEGDSTIRAFTAAEFNQYFGSRIPSNLDITRSLRLAPP